MPRSRFIELPGLPHPVWERTVRLGVMPRSDPSPNTSDDRTDWSDEFVNGVWLGPVPTRGRVRFPERRESAKCQRTCPGGDKEKNKAESPFGQ